MSTQISLNEIETKIFQLIDKDMTLFEADKGSFKIVLQYNPVSKLYIVVRGDVVSKTNDVLCITKKPTMAMKIYNEATV